MYFSGNPEPLHHSFHRWLGRTLNARQARVISLLEKLRRSRTEEPRLFIHDDHSTPDDNLPALIVDYFRWLHARTRQRLPNSLIIARSKKSARQIAPERIFYRGRLNAIHHWRGVDFANLLVVDADRVPMPIADPLWQDPRSFHQFLQLRCVTQACNPHSVVVIIGNAARWSTQFSLNFFDIATNPSSRYVAYAHNPLPRYLVRRHAAHIKPYRPGCNPFRPQILAVKSPRIPRQHIPSPQGDALYNRMSARSRAGLRAPTHLLFQGATRPLLRPNSLSLKNFVLKNSASLPAGSAQGRPATVSAILPPETQPSTIPATQPARIRWVATRPQSAPIQLSSDYCFENNPRQSAFTLQPQGWRSASGLNYFSSIPKIPSRTDIISIWLIALFSLQPRARPSPQLIV